MSKLINRLDFIKTSALAGATAAILPHTLLSSPVLNNNINLGFIGTGLRGQLVL